MLSDHFAQAYITTLTPFPSEAQFRQIAEIEARACPDDGRLKFGHEEEYAVDKLNVFRGYYWYAAVMGCDERVVAYALFDCSTDDAYLEDLAVDPPAQNMGLAQRLLEYAVDDVVLKGATGVWTKVWPGNKTALRVCEKRGFERTDEQPRDEGRGVVQRLRIKNPRRNAWMPCMGIF